MNARNILIAALLAVAVAVSPTVTGTADAAPKSKSSTSWRTTGVVIFEDGSWRNMNTGKTGCLPNRLCD